MQFVPMLPSHLMVSGFCLSRKECWSLLFLDFPFCLSYCFLRKVYRILSLMISFKHFIIIIIFHVGLGVPIPYAYLFLPQ